MTDQKETNMTAEIVSGGPSQGEAQELNRPKQSKSRFKTLERTANVLAPTLTTRLQEVGISS